MTDTDCLRNCPPSSHAFLWMRESYFRHGRVFVVALPALWYRDVSHVSHLCPAKYFHHRMVRGRVSVSRFPRGNVGGDCEGPGLQFSEYWRSWDSDQCGNTERMRGVVSGEGGGSIGVGVTSALLSSHPSHPWARPGSVLFCIIIIIITRVSHRPASSARVTGPREPVPKQYQENKSEDQL